MPAELSFDSAAAIDRPDAFPWPSKESPGQEQAIAAEGVQSPARGRRRARRALQLDTANEHIPLPTQTGNLIVTLPGTRPGPRLLFSTHLDTVPLCAGAVPQLKGKKITPMGATALGGDNRTGVACLVTLAASLLAKKADYPPLTLLFTVREESGLFGARYVNPDDLGGVKMGFNVDGKEPAHFAIGAVGAERFEVEITGKASHAGVHPEQGISATMVAALALAEVKQKGFFGKIVQDGKEGTSNIGSFGSKDGIAAGEENHQRRHRPCPLDRRGAQPRYEIRRSPSSRPIARRSPTPPSR